MKYLRVLAVFALGLLWLPLRAEPALAEAQEAAQEAGTEADGVADGIQEYTVKSGDSPSKIARQFYGDSRLGRRLLEANRHSLGDRKVIRPGDIIYIYPREQLRSGTAGFPPPPPEKPASLYDRGTPLDIAFPEYFSFVADSRGLGGSGIIRAKVKKINPQSREEETAYMEIRAVGEIIASEDRGYRGDDWTVPVRGEGRAMLSWGDLVHIRFVEDVAKILDSDTHGQADPYFREYPIYSVSKNKIPAFGRRPDKGSNLGQLMRYVGKVTVVSRVEGLAPASSRTSSKAKKTKNANAYDIEPVSYVGKITYSSREITVGDKVFLFVPLDPGPERMIDGPYIETPGSYAPAGY